ncbi:putative sugar kinase [Ochrobactrum phage vB_OspM_OC]|nr:putative sugar kinase [Ochrobactrum phage vB_OspM_OC]
MANIIYLMSFPHMGRTTAVKEFSEPFDGETFKVVEMEVETPLKDFVKKLKELDDNSTYDFILLPYHERLRKLMFEADLPIVSVYPNDNLMETMIAKCPMAFTEDKSYYSNIVNSFEECPFSVVRISVMNNDIFITHVIKSILGDSM